MRVAVIGATGTVGRPTADRLEQRGHEVRRLGRQGGTHRVDLTTGDGLVAALDGVDAIVNASNGPASKRAAHVLVDGTDRIVHASSAHHVCVSIVGIDALSRYGAYYRVKLEQEQHVKAARVPFTIIRATQFHEFLARPLLALARVGLRPRSQELFQPVAVGEVAAAIADVIDAGPSHATVTVAGPEILSISRLCDWRGLPAPVPLPPRLRRALRAGAATDQAPNVRGTITWSEWLAAAR